jgi:hypothetical protein
MESLYAGGSQIAYPRLSDVLLGDRSRNASTSGFLEPSSTLALLSIHSLEPTGRRRSRLPDCSS